MDSLEGQLLTGSMTVQPLNEDTYRSACITEEGMDSCELRQITLGHGIPQPATIAKYKI